MKLSEGIKTLGKPYQIPNCGRNDLVPFFQERGFKKGVEIGVFEGAFTEVLARGGFEVWGVDPWMVYEDYGTPQYQPKADERYNKSKERLGKYINAHILRLTSMEALEHFEDDSLDFVYIDGNHQFKYIAEDLYEWWKKVKKGGVICGHDYAYFRKNSPCGGCQVREVVDAYALAFHCNFWVLGERIRKEGEMRDDYRSWMFIKGDERDMW